MNPQLTAALLVGGLLTGGAWAFAYAFAPATARLDDALALLNPDQAGPSEPDLVGANAGRIERLGAWSYRRLHLPLAARTARLLQLRGTSIGEFLGEKLLLGLAGLVLPWVGGLVALALTGEVFTWPAAAALALGVLGFFYPDLALLRRAHGVRADVGEALFTYFDLVTLERLAGMSATQALTCAAALSEAPIFADVRNALERARLEQRPPFAELGRLAGDLDLPELADIADVMRLDEAGASLSGLLRARVAELRDAHLTKAKQQAHAVSERMTFWMVIPAVVFSLIFLVPPLLRLLAT